MRTFLGKNVKIFPKLLLFSKVQLACLVAMVLESWVAVAKDGEIIFANCSCMAGLGEVCSHVSATLYHLEAHVAIIQKRMGTSRPNQWIIPASVKHIECVMGSDIDFGKIGNSSTPKDLTGPKYTPLSAEQRNELYSSLAATGIKPAILSITPGFLDSFVPISTTLPPSLQALYKENNEKLSQDELKSLCNETMSQLKISKEHVDKIAEVTTKQSKSKTWYFQRAGRITASRARACVHTSLSKPAPSLIKAVCYPEVYGFSSKATTWGCDHEKAARNHYENLKKKEHAKFTIKNTGFHISMKSPFIGASPDGMIECECCGQGLVEVKCPYCSSDPSDVKYIQTDQDTGITKLNRDHTYYYQVQVQMYTLDLRFCDLVVYCEKETENGKESRLYVERIPYNAVFMSIFLPKAEAFFTQAILPELLAKQFTRALPISQPSPAAEANGSGLLCGICFCGQSNLDSRILECTNPTCKIKKYHFVCLGYKKKPFVKNGWRCQACKGGKGGNK